MQDALFTSEEQRAFDDGIAKLLTRYPPEHKRAAMLPALRLLQSMKGWLPPAGMKQISEKLGTSLSHAYEVATFYVMYFTEKPGDHVIDVCTNLSCSLRGAQELMDYLEEKLGTKRGVNGPKFYLRETECLASCATAPCLQVNEEHHENLTRAKVDALIERLKR